jgi:hypothetical protein
MFRRRTDQVYSTLQQVQRRITEQAGMPADLGEGQAPPAIPPANPVNLQPLAQALPTGGIPHQPQPPSPVQQYVSATGLGQGGKRYVLQLSGDLAMLLVVVWLISMALMFVLGQHWRSTGGAGLAAGPAGSRELPVVAPAKRLGDWAYLLESSSNATESNISHFEERARTLNDFVLKNPGRGGRPYFGVRRPPNGGIELAYGMVDGVWGIDQKDHLPFAKLLADPQSKGGAGYSSARWVKVDQ